MKKTIKLLSVILLVCFAFSALAGCAGTKTETPKEEQTGTAGSNIPLKDDVTKAQEEIVIATKAWIAEAFGDNAEDSTIYVQKTYTAEEEQEIEGLKALNLTPDEVAFELNFELKPAEGADINLLTATDGYLDAESGWVKDKFILGVLRPSEDAESGYMITNVGTGW